LSSCSVEEHTGEDVDSLSVDGYSTSDSSSNDGDIDDDDDTSPSPPVSAARNRSSRRKDRRRTAAPYCRARRLPKRKEIWMDTDTRQGCEMPAFLLGSPPRARRSGRHCY
jgi:hypothetical protein